MHRSIDVHSMLRSLMTQPRSTNAKARLGGGGELPVLRHEQVKVGTAGRHLHELRMWP